MARLLALAFTERRTVENRNARPAGGTGGLGRCTAVWLVASLAVLCTACGSDTHPTSPGSTCPQNRLASAGTPAQPADELISRLSSTLTQQRYVKEHLTDIGIARQAPLGSV